jgi:hypothetical protein
MEEFNKDSENQGQDVFSKRIRAGKRTYFIDVKATKGNDFYITITESKKKLGNKFIRHKIFLYKEDFNKFAQGLQEVIEHVKNELMPDYDYDKFDRESSGSGTDDISFDSSDFDSDFKMDDDES